MLKWIGRLLVLGILVFLAMGAFAYFYSKSFQPPEIKDAPYALQVYYDNNGEKFPTRIYYAEKIELNGGKAELTTFWTYDGERYHKHRGNLEVDPPYDIVRRLK